MSVGNSYTPVLKPGLGRVFFGEFSLVQHFVYSCAKFPSASGKVGQSVLFSEESHQNEAASCSP